MLDGYDGAYLVFFTDLSDLAGQGDAARRLVLDDTVKELAEMVDGRVVHSAPIKLDEHLGLSCDLELSDPPGLFRSRLYLVGERLYRLTAVGDLEFALSERADTFLGSFRLLP